MQAAQLRVWRRALSTGAAHFSPRATTGGIPLPHGVGLPHRQSLAWRPLSRTEMGAARSARSARAARAGAERTNMGEMGGEIRGRLLLSYHDLERALERRGLNRVRVAIGGGLAVVVLMAVCWPRIKRWGAAEGAEVAAASLQEQQVQAQAGHTLRAVLQDPGTGEEVRMVLRSAVLDLLEDEEVTTRATRWAARVLSDAVMTDEMREVGERYVGAVLSADDSREMARMYVGDAVSAVAGSEVIQDVVASSIWAGVRASVVGRRRQAGGEGRREGEDKAAVSRQKRVEETPASTTPATLAAGVNESEQLSGRRGD
ncbi:unnamed protein product [Agarophyton chilense]